MRFAILTLILFFSGCTVTTYHHPRPIIIEEVYHPRHIIIHSPYRYYNNSYTRRNSIKRKIRYHNGVRVYRKNYWSKTTKHPQSERIQRNGSTRSENLKRRIQERRKDWHDKRKSLKDR